MTRARRGAAMVLPLLVAASALAAGCLRDVPRPQAPEVVGVETEWGDVDDESIELVATVTFRNPNPVAITVPDARFDVLANGINLGEGRLAEEATLEPEAETDVVVVTVLDNRRFVPDWWRTHVERNETSTLTVDGSADVVLGPAVVGVPFSRERSWSTDVLGGLDSRLRNCPTAGELPCIESSEHRWGETSDERTIIESIIVVHNPLPVPIPLPIDGTSMELRLNDFPVASGEADEDVLLDPRSTTRVPFTTALEHDALRKWWPTHVEACERSDASAAVRFLDGQVAVSAPLEPVETSFACG